MDGGGGYWIANLAKVITYVYLRQVSFCLKASHSIAAPLTSPLFKIISGSFVGYEALIMVAI